MADFKLRDQYLIEIKNKISKLNNLTIEIIELKSRVNDLLIGINKCPLMIIEKIFTYLDFEDLINCCKVCKKWMKAIENLKIENLKIIEDSKYENDYSYESEFIKKQYPFVSLKFDLEPKNVLLKNIKHLKVIRFEYFEDNYHVLSDLPLEILEIDSMGSNLGRGWYIVRLIEIKLENVKYMCFDYIGSNNFRFDCPILKAIASGVETELSNFRFKNPENIKHLYMNYAAIGREDFKNLESIFCFEDYYHYNLKFYLKDYPNLKLIYLVNKETTIGILNKKKELKLDNLNVVLNGVLIDNADQIDNFTCLRNERFDISLIEHPIKKLNFLKNSKRIKLN